MSLTSSGSMSLNSMPRPVQAMKWELDGSSSRATRNCQSCSEPLRWYDGPSRYRPVSCLMSPTGHMTNLYSSVLKHDCMWSRFKHNILKYCCILGGLTFNLFRHHAGVIVEMPHHFVKHTTWKTRWIRSLWFDIEQKSKVHNHNIQSNHRWYLQSC